MLLHTKNLCYKNIKIAKSSTQNLGNINMKIIFAVFEIVWADLIFKVGTLRITAQIFSMD